MGCTCNQTTNHLVLLVQGVLLGTIVTALAGLSLYLAHRTPNARPPRGRDVTARMSDQYSSSTSSSSSSDPSGDDTVQDGATLNQNIYAPDAPVAPPVASPIKKATKLAAANKGEPKHHAQNEPALPRRKSKRHLHDAAKDRNRTEARASCCTM